MLDYELEVKDDGNGESEDEDVGEHVCQRCGFVHGGDVGEASSQLTWLGALFVLISSAISMPCFDDATCTKDGDFTLSVVCLYEERQGVMEDSPNCPRQDCIGRLSRREC